MTGSNQRSQNGTRSLPADLCFMMPSGRRAGVGLVPY
jgi:hypothetical protein